MLEVHRTGEDEGNSDYCIVSVVRSSATYTSV